MAKKSAAASNLCNLVINIIQYHKVYRKVQPLDNEQAGGGAD
jgi:hypothetical protein